MNVGHYFARIIGLQCVYSEAKELCTSDFGVACLMMVDVGDNDAGSAHTVESVPEMDDDDSSLSSQDDSHLNR